MRYVTAFLSPQFRTTPCDTYIPSAMALRAWESSAETLSSYLRSSRTSLALSRASLVPTLYLGNESCDLDSLASAIALAYTNAQSCSQRCPVPIANRNLSSSRLRGDAAEALSLARISSADIPDLSVLPPIQSLLSRSVSVVLVDHNNLAVHQRELSPLVREVVDHHTDAGLHLDASPRIIQPVGSCATLASAGVNHPTVAFLVLCAILADTSCLKKRVTDADVAACERMCRIAGVDHSELSSIYQRLDDAKRDVTGFSAHDLLRLDCKTFGSNVRAVVPSVPLSLEKWTNLQGDGKLKKKHLYELQMEKGAAVVVVLTAHKDSGRFERELLVCGLGSIPREMNERISYCEEGNLQLRGKLLGGWHYAQLNREASRKIFGPAIERVLLEIENL